MTIAGEGKHDFSEMHISKKMMFCKEHACGLNVAVNCSCCATDGAKNPAPSPRWSRLTPISSYCRCKDANGSVCPLRLDGERILVLYELFNGWSCKVRSEKRPLNCSLIFDRIQSEGPVVFGSFLEQSSR